MNLFATASCGVLATALLSGVAYGQAADQVPSAVETVIVTAQKRAEDVQDVPVSISAFSRNTLEAAGVQDVRDLRRITANLNLTTSLQVTNTRVMIRGIGTAANSAIEPSVATFVDGAYVARVGSLLAGLNDIASVAVLRGPQGTLFGRNASMGAIDLRTGDPSRNFGGEVRGSIGNYGSRRFTGMITGPLAENIAGRLSVLAYTLDGYGVNDLDGRRVGQQDSFSVRGGLRWEIAPTLTWTVKGDYQHITGNGRPVLTVLASSVTPTFAANWKARLDPDGAGPLVGETPYLDRTYSRHVYQEQSGNLNDYQTGFVSDLTWQGPLGHEIKLISAYRDWHDLQLEGSSAIVPLPLQSRLSTFDSASHSEELQIVSPTSLFGGKVNYVAGLYYFKEDYDIDQAADLYPAYCNVFLKNTSTAARVAACNANPLHNAAVSYFDQTTKSYAAYLQGTYRVTDAIGVTGGIRYTKDEKDGLFRALSPNPTASQANEVTTLAVEQDKVTYRVDVTYRPSEDVMLFVNYSTGFKSGGFDSSPGTTPVGAANRTFRPETTTDWEVGVKSELFDHRLIANVNLYRTDISDYQFRTFDGVRSRVRNNGELRQQGVEFDLVARPTTPLTMTLSGAYLDSKYLDFRGAPALPGFGTPQDLTGTRPPYAPKWQGAASAQYIGDLVGGMTWLARSDISFTSSQNLSASADNNPQAIQKGYALVGARLAVRGPGERWEVAVSGQNLTSKDVCVGIFNQGNLAAYGIVSSVTGLGVLRCTLNEPRTVALEVKSRF